VFVLKKTSNRFLILLLRRCTMKRYCIALLMSCIAVVAFASGGSEGPVPIPKTSSGYPNRPIQIYLPANAGTGTDTTVRVIAPYLEKYLGVPVIINNDAAAAGTISMRRVAQAVPDGYTWGYWTIVWVANRCMGEVIKGSINPVTDYVWAGGNYQDQVTVVTTKNGPYKSLDDIVKAAKAKPNSVVFVRSAAGDVTSLSIEWLEKFKNVKFNILSGLDGGESMAGIMGGHIDVYVDNFSSSNQLYLDGSIEIAAIGGSQRAPELPNVATFDEQGYEGWPVKTSERHFYGASKIPAENVEIFREALRRAAMDPEYIESCKKINLRPYYADANESLKQIKQYVDMFTVSK
jgi:tripartite-type tricarboxylate transporter receptor subunit TctC